MLFALPATSRTVSLENENNATVRMLGGVFNSLEVKTNATAGMAQWTQVRKKIIAQERTFADCVARKRGCSAKVRQWREALKPLRQRTGYQLLEAVNRLGNRSIKYRSDQRTYGRADYWASPMESFLGAGDCEDYALLKYASLRALGFDEDRMRIVIVDDTKRRIGHAVLSVRLDGGLYILDSLELQPKLHSQFHNYKPIYSVNVRGRWINVATRPARRENVVALSSGDAVRPTLDDSQQLAITPTVKIELNVVPSFSAEMRIEPVMKDWGRELP